MTRPPELTEEEKIALLTFMQRAAEVPFDPIVWEKHLAASCIPHDLEQKGYLEYRKGPPHHNKPKKGTGGFFFPTPLADLAMDLGMLDL